MLTGVAPAPSGHDWQFLCSVGVDCCDAEPRCILLAVLKGVSVPANPCAIAITTPIGQCSAKVLQGQRLSWVIMNHYIIAFACTILINIEWQ